METELTILRQTGKCEMLAVYDLSAATEKFLIPVNDADTLSSQSAASSCSRIPKLLIVETTIQVELECLLPVICEKLWGHAGFFA